MQAQLQDAQAQIDRLTAQSTAQEGTVSKLKRLLKDCSPNLLGEEELQALLVAVKVVLKTHSGPTK